MPHVEAIVRHVLRARKLYGKRMESIEPVCGNLRANQGLERFHLRGQAKVNTQSNLYGLVHNIEKLAHHGYGDGARKKVK